jgi:hypothetical protein
MESTYHQYRIEILTDKVQGMDQWTFRALVFVPDGESQTVKRFSYRGPSFSTEDDAERQGLSFMQKWIDDGMPDVT